MVDITKYQIVANSKFGRRGSKPGRNYICYRTILSYIGHKMILEDPDEDFFEFLGKLQDCISHKQSLENGYVELYYVSSPYEAYIFVDQTNGTFPLVLYYYPKNTESSRINAFNEAIGDLINSHVKLTEMLCQHREWTDALQEKLQLKVFHYRTPEVNKSNSIDPPGQ